MAKVTRKELTEVIGERTLHIKDKQKLVNGIAAYLAAEHNQVDLASLTRDVMQYRLERGYVEAVAVSAHDLPQNVIDDIVALLKEHYPSAKHVHVDTLVDESIVGGIRIELPREVLDLSVKSKLNLFKHLVAEEGIR